MDWRIELIFFPVSDVDRSLAFYRDQVGFTLDHDHTPHEGLRFVQFTPPGSACSIAFGTGIHDGEPGTQNTVQVVVPDADEALAHLQANGVKAQGVEELSWGRFVTFADPDGNTWTLQQLPDRV